MSKDDVALALNHIDNYHKIIDIYLEKDWKIVDEVQKSVLNKLHKDLKKEEANKEDKFKKELNISGTYANATISAPSRSRNCSTCL